MRRKRSSYLSCSLGQFRSKLAFHSRSVLAKRNAKQSMHHHRAADSRSANEEKSLKRNENRNSPAVVIAEIMPVLDDKFVQRSIHDLRMVRQDSTLKTDIAGVVRMSRGTQRAWAKGRQEFTWKYVSVDPGIDLSQVTVADSDRVQKQQAIVFQASSANLEKLVVVAVDSRKF